MLYMIDALYLPVQYRHTLVVLGSNHTLIVSGLLGCKSYLGEKSLSQTVDSCMVILVDHVTRGMKALLVTQVLE
jgi:hypothetical protein